MTYYALCATAKGKGRDIINGVPFCTYRAGGEEEDPEPYRGRRIVFEHQATGQTLHVLLTEVKRDVTLPIASSGTGGLWTVWILAADDYRQPNGDSWVGRIKMHLAANTNSADVFGPFALANAIATYPAYCDDLLKDGNGNWSFPVLNGDQSHHERLVQIDEDANGEPVFPPEE